MLKLRWHLIAVIICLFVILTVQVLAQDTAPSPEETPAALPTEEPPVSTEIPTVVEVTAEATVETPAAPPPEVTVEPPMPPPATPVVPGLPPEPVLALLVRDLFDSGDLSQWALGANWTLAANETGLNLQTAAADMLQLRRGPFTNAAAQLRLNLTAGSLHLSLGQSAVGSYSAALDASGQMTLYRAGVPVQSALVLLPPGPWQTLRLSLMDGVLRVAVNGVEVIAWQDAAPLPPGTLALLALPPADGSPFNLQVDEVFVWVPEADASLYPPPTPAPTLAPTAEPTEVVLPIVTLEATAEVTAEPTAEPTTEATIEPTAEVTPLVDPLTGKSLVAVEYVPPFGVQATDHNQHAGARNVPLPLPFYNNDTTDGNTTDGESNLGLTCGFNITATVWYRFLPAATKQYIFSTDGSAFDTILVVYPDSGGAPAALPTNPLACNDDVVATNLTSKLTLTLTQGQTYWIRLGGYNGEHGSYRLAVQEAVLPVPLAPRLSSPANNSVSSVSSQTFQWQPPLTGPAPAHYELQISSVSTFATLVHSAIVPASQTSYPYSLADGGYFWRVRSLNANFAGGGWASAWKRTVDTAAPAAPALKTPLENATSTLVRPILAWNAVPGAVRYRVSLVEFGQPTSLLLPNKEVVTTPSLSLSTLVMQQPLQQGKRYAWYVIAIDAAANESAASATWTFTVNLMNAPAEGAAVVAADGRPTLTWFAAGFPGALYVLEVNTSADFSGALVYTSLPLTTLSHKLPAALPAAAPPRYYWRLRVVNHPGGDSVNAVPRSFVLTPAVPPTVTLLTPANLKVLKDNPVVLTWRGLANTLPRSPFSYRVQVGTDRTFAAGIVFDQDTAVGATSAPVAGLGEGVYFWRVRAVNADTAPGVWSAVWSFTVDRTAPAAPALKAPLPAAVVTLPRPTLTWNPSPTAVAYIVTLSENGGATLVDNRRVTTTSLLLSPTVLPQPLQHGKSYSWNVKAEDAAGNLSAASVSWSFTVNLMNAPADNIGVLVPAFPGSRTFTWYAAGLAGASYKVEVSTSSADWSAARSCTTAALSCALAGDQRLPAGGTYFWRLLVLVGGTPQNPTVPVRSFVAATTLPGVPTPSSPAPGAPVNVPPTLTWSGPSGAFAHYELQVSTTNTFTPPLFHTAIIPSGTTTYSGLPALTNGVTYWWRLRAVNADGAGGGWSNPRWFVFDTDAPTGVPVLLTPAHNSAFTGPLPRFTWRAAAGFTRYEIQIITSGDFITPPPLGFVVATTSFTPPGPLLYTGYRWRVRGLDPAGNGGPWSSPFELKVISASTAVPVLNRFQDNTPTLTWTPISWAKAYEVQISYNSAFTSLLPGIAAAPGTPPPYSYTPPPLPNGTYYWRVRAQRQDSTWGPWSTGGTGIFQVDLP